MIDFKDLNPALRPGPRNGLCRPGANDFIFGINPILIINPIFIINPILIISNNVLYYPILNMQVARLELAINYLEGNRISQLCYTCFLLFN